MNEDITFCAADCANKGCEINKRRIKQPIPHSFAVFDCAEIVYSDKYEDYVCKACGEMLPCHTGFQFCPFCGRPFKLIDKR